MTRQQLEAYIEERYGAAGDYPWTGEPDYEVFRHANNRKWFALLMKLPDYRLGISAPEGKEIYVLNVKSSPALIASLPGEKGLYPAYHMSKKSWLSIAIEEAEEEKLKWLLEMSYDLTSVKPKRNRKTEENQNE